MRNKNRVTYSTLITAAIRSSPHGMCTITDILKYITYINRLNTNTGTSRPSNNKLYKNTEYNDNRVISNGNNIEYNTHSVISNTNDTISNKLCNSTEYNTHSVISNEYNTHSVISNDNIILSECPSSVITSVRQVLSRDSQFIKLARREGCRVSEWIHFTPIRRRFPKPLSHLTEIRSALKKKGIYKEFKFTHP
ncbi:hypothetical protein NEIRO03_0857 [Nematocida sp. AWRm78]|nr:hypothetical protein NEIRO02_1122 [Nematocida sp. AWRm79]KAI5183242.1 hypothetical protein NEIRO03_0857 [Nematocida sp. AWRm78]